MLDAMIAGQVPVALFDLLERLAQETSEQDGGVEEMADGNKKAP